VLLTSRWTKLRYHPEQQRLLTSKARLKPVIAGRGGGKTELAKRVLVASLPVPKPWRANYAYFAPTEQQAKRIAWDDLMALTPKEWLMGGEPRRAELRLLTRWGASLWVVGLDKPSRIEGMQLDGGVVDERSDQKPGAVLKTVYPMLTHRDGWLWEIGVPKRFGPSAAEFQQLIDDGKKGEAVQVGETRLDVEAFEWSSEDIIGEDRLAWLRARLSPQDYEEQIVGRFVAAGGAAFLAFSDLNLRRCRYDPTLPVECGMDFNRNPMAWTLGHHYPGEERLEWWGEVWLEQANTVSALDILCDRLKDHRGGVRLYPDASVNQHHTAAQVSDLQHLYNHDGLRKLGREVIVRSSNPPVVDRIACCNAAFLSADGRRRMLIDPDGCPRLLADVRTRPSPTSSEAPPLKRFQGHPSDAMGYACMAILPMTFDVEDELGGDAPVVVQKGD
jgi:hypothetical protein